MHCGTFMLKSMYECKTTSINLQRWTWPLLFSSGVRDIFKGLNCSFQSAIRDNAKPYVKVWVTFTCGLWSAVWHISCLRLIFFPSFLWCTHSHHSTLIVWNALTNYARTSRKWHKWFSGEKRDNEPNWSGNEMPVEESGCNWGWEEIFRYIKSKRVFSVVSFCQKLIFDMYHPWNVLSCFVF